MNLVRSDHSGFPKLWERLCIDNEFLYPFYQGMNLKYYKEIAQDSKFVDRSIVIAEQQIALIGMRMAIREYEDNTKELSCFGLPILYLESQKVEMSQIRKAHKLLKAELENILSQDTISKIIYRDYLAQTQLSFLSHFFLNRGAVATPHFTRVIELSLSGKDLYQQVRKSYKSLINWGGENLSIKLYDQQSIQKKDMNSFRQLHINTAGRETRSRKTWDLQYEMVCCGEAFLFFGELEKELVTAALFLCSPMYCVYGVSASNRDMFDKPLSHALLWNAILHAKKIGCSILEMGDLQYPRQGDPVPTQKELGITTFKKGFGGQTLTHLNVIWG